MKKLLSLVFASVMVIAMTMPAFAHGAGADSSSTATKLQKHPKKKTTSQTSKTNTKKP